MFDIVIPVWNEELRLPQTLEKIQAFAEAEHCVGKVIIVDDHSTDGTADVIREWSAAMPCIVTGKSLAKGKGSAVKTGMLMSQADYALFSDADLSTPIEFGLDLLHALERQGADVAIGSRHMPGSVVTGRSPLRKLMSWGVNTLDHMLLGNSVHDSQCGFKMFSRHAREVIFPRQTINGFGFDMELIAIVRVHALKIVEVPVSWEHTPHSRISALKDSFAIFREMMDIRAKAARQLYS